MTKRLGLGRIGILSTGWISFLLIVTAQSVKSQAADFAIVQQLLAQNLQQERQVEDDLEQKLEMREIIQHEVDRAFSNTTTLLNVLLTILTVLPILTGGLLFLSRRRLVQELHDEMEAQIRKEIENQVQAELKEQTLAVQKKMLELEQETLAVTRQMQEQANEFQEEVDQLKTEFQMQLETLRNTATEVEREKDRIFQQITSITLVATSKDDLPDEKKRQIETLTEQLTNLKRSCNLDLDANNYVREGDALFFAGLYTEAILAYDRAIKQTIVDTNNLFAAWHGKTKALRRLKQYEQALEASTRAMALKPDDHLMWFERAYLLHLEGKYPQALDIYDRLIAERPSFFRARNHRGYVLLKLQQYEEAIAELDKSIEIKPDYGNAYYGKALYYTIHNQPDLALENLKTAIHYYPKYRAIVQNDVDFSGLWHNSDFKKLIEANGSIKNY